MKLCWVYASGVKNPTYIATELTKTSEGEIELLNIGERTLSASQNLKDLVPKIKGLAVEHKRPVCVICECPFEVVVEESGKVDDIKYRDLNKREIRLLKQWLAEKPEEKSAEHNPAAGRNQSIT